MNKVFLLLFSCLRTKAEDSREQSHKRERERERERESLCIKKESERAAVTTSEFYLKDLFSHKNMKQAKAESE